ncbi:MAG: NAD-dependent deacylase [Planctomycetota bacterium]
MQRLEAGDRLTILTGAGVSAESGLATFRGGGGLWEGHRVEDVATPEGWARDPGLVWRFYQMRRAALGGVQPNAAHFALARLEQWGREHDVRVHLITQNVDDLHQRAGSTVLPMHGELEVLRCERCDHRVRELTSLDEAVFVPCPACGHTRLRPDIVWFGEVPYGMDAIEDILMNTTHFLSAGTSGAVWPAAGFLHAARSVGARTYVNALEAPANLEPGDRFLEGPASQVLPEFAARCMGEVR